MLAHYYCKTSQVMPPNPLLLEPEDPEIAIHSSLQGTQSTFACR